MGNGLATDSILVYSTKAISDRERERKDSRKNNEKQGV